MTIKPIPTDSTELCALLRVTPRHERDQIRQQLVDQLGDEDEAWRLFNDAESTVRHEEQVVTARAGLRASLTATCEQLAATIAWLERLVGNELYDVEYAESPTATGDMLAFLADAARLVRAAAALNPCPVEKPA